MGFLLIGFSVFIFFLFCYFMLVDVHSLFCERILISSPGLVRHVNFFLFYAHKFCSNLFSCACLVHVTWDAFNFVCSHAKFFPFNNVLPSITKRVRFTQFSNFSVAKGVSAVQQELVHTLGHVTYLQIFVESLNPVTSVPLLSHLS